MYPDMTEEEAKQLFHISDIFTFEELRTHSKRFWIKIHHLIRDGKSEQYRKLQLAGVRARYILEPLAILEK